MAFSPKELEFDNTADYNSEMIRTKQIFDVLKLKAIANEYLSEHEKEFFAMGIKHSIANEGKLEDYECCDNPKFKLLYLVYARDIFGFKKREYYKPKRTFEYRLKEKEIKNDLYYLNTKSKEWEKIINTKFHEEELLHQSAKEARDEIKELKKKYSKNIQGINSVQFLSKRKAIILHSKWLYCMALEIYESLDSNEFISSINGEEVVFNEFSLIHILNRHYAQILKQFDTKKSFHSEMFKPRILSSQIKEIIKLIDKSKLLTGKSIDKIAFRIDSIDYIIYTGEKIKGSKTYRRLNTFFPVHDIYEKKILNDNYILQSINQTLSVHIPR